MTWTSAIQAFESSGCAGQVWRSSASDIQILGLVSELSRDGWIAVALRGALMTRPEDVFEEFSTRLRFPPYFGRNWDALEECITDLDWFLPTRGIVVALTDLERMSDARVVEPLLSILQSGISMWADADAQANYMARDAVAIPFHVVLQDWSQSVGSLWSSAIEAAHPLDGRV